MLANPIMAVKKQSVCKSKDIVVYTFAILMSTKLVGIIHSVYNLHHTRRPPFMRGPKTFSHRVQLSRSPVPCQLCQPRSTAGRDSVQLNGNISACLTECPNNGKQDPKIEKDKEKSREKNDATLDHRLVFSGTRRQPSAYLK